MSSDTVTTTPGPTSAGLGRRVGKSVFWQAANTSSLRAANFLIGIIVARIVTPYDFGVFTIALTISTILGSLISFGFAYAIVREHDRTREIAPTAYTLSIAMSAIVTLVMVLAAPYLTRALGSEDATGALRVLALFVLMAAFSSIPVSLLVRDFMQRQRFIIDGASVAGSTVVMFVLIYLGHPVMGLAVSSVFGQLIAVILANRMAPEHYRPGFSWPEAKHLIRFGAPLTGGRLVELIIANIDFIIVGHLLGARQLGYYSLAFNICGWPLMVFNGILESIVTPVLSRVRESPAELVRHLQAAVSAIAATAFPVCALLAALAAPLIETVYGPRWHPAWAPLVMLTIFGAARTVLTIFWDLLVSLGMTRRLLAIQMIWLTALVPAMYFGVRTWHTVGAGVAHAAVITGVALPAYFVTVRSKTRLGLGWFRRGIAIPLPAAIAGGMAAFAASSLLETPYLKLVLGVMVGLLVYALIAGRWLWGIAGMLREMYWDPARPVGEEAPATSSVSRVRGAHRSKGGRRSATSASGRAR